MSTAVEPTKLTNEQYHALDSISHSRLEDFRSSKRKYKAKYIDKTLERKQTPAMQLGSLVHALVLEPHTFDENYILAPKCDRRTNAGKAAWNEFCELASGKEVIDFETMESAKAISGAVLENELAMELIGADCLIENPVFWTCPHTGLQCRSKPDVDNREAAYLLDLKSCQDATPGGFAKSAASFGYARQAAWYQTGHEIAYGYRPAFVFVAVSTNEPYEVGIYELSENDILRSKLQNNIDLAELAECMKTGVWTARHESQIVNLALPKWAEFEDQYQSY
jgi:hypothetical protein